MGLNRMMMKNGEVEVADGFRLWDWESANNKTISFTVPPGIKRIEVTSSVDTPGGTPDIDIHASIKNTSTNKVWGEGWFVTSSTGLVREYKDINSIVGVTPNKTYSLLFDCRYTAGVAFSWDKEINDKTPTVEDY